MPTRTFVQALWQHTSIGSHPSLRLLNYYYSRQWKDVGRKKNVILNYIVVYTVLGPLLWSVCAFDVHFCSSIRSPLHWHSGELTLSSILAARTEIEFLLLNSIVRHKWKHQEKTTISPSMRFFLLFVFGWCLGSGCGYEPQHSTLSVNIILRMWRMVGKVLPKLLGKLLNIRKNHRHVLIQQQPHILNQNVYKFRCSKSIDTHQKYYKQTKICPSTIEDHHCYSSHLL